MKANHVQHQPRMFATESPRFRGERNHSAVCLWLQPPSGTPQLQLHFLIDDLTDLASQSVGGEGFLQEVNSSSVDTMP